MKKVFSVALWEHRDTTSLWFKDSIPVEVMMLDLSYRGFRSKSRKGGKKGFLNGNSVGEGTEAGSSLIRFRCHE